MNYVRARDRSDNRHCDGLSPRMLYSVGYHIHDSVHYWREEKKQAMEGNMGQIVEYRKKIATLNRECLFKSSCHVKIDVNHEVP